MNQAAALLATQAAIAKARTPGDLFHDLFDLSDAALLRIVENKPNVSELELHLADRLIAALDALASVEQGR